MTAKEAHAHLDDLEFPDAALTPWEEDFCASIREKLYAGWTLTERQVETLVRIHEDKG